MTDMNQIYDRIQKLLAMAKDASSPNEAMIAMERARRLMNKYQIEESDMIGRDADDSRFSFQSLLKKQYKFMPTWLNTLAVAVGELNGVRGGLVEGNIVVAGFNEDVQLAVMMYDRLVEECNRMCKIDQIARGYGTKYNAKMGDAFKKGFAVAVHEKVKEIIAHQAMECDSTALILHKADAVAKRFGETKVKTSKMDIDRDADSAYHAGKQHGRKAQLQTEI
ncbi:hypothetical protein [Acinetobacter phage pB23]|nr:hypothetical protein [Acinetobacter phage pB23]